jgi:hypothetical protein
MERTPSSSRRTFEELLRKYFLWVKVYFRGLHHQLVERRGFLAMLNSRQEASTKSKEATTTMNSGILVAPRCRLHSLGQKKIYEFSILVLRGVLARNVNHCLHWE